jgi:hypothetical protein
MGEGGSQEIPLLLEGYWIDAIALAGATVCLAATMVARLWRKMPWLNRDQAQTVFMNGASISALLLLAMSAWNEKWIVETLKQERLILVAAIVFAIWDEGQRIFAYWQAPKNA